MANLASARAQRFHAYVERLTTALGHQDRHGPVRAYVTGLCLPGERKSIEPMAARVDPRHVRARHQSMHHLVANAPWEDAAMLGIARDVVLMEMDRHGPVAAWLVDDTSFPKKGQHSVGVAHQYCGQLGKQANCQVAVSLSIANDAASLPVAYRLYLTKDWAEDAARRSKVGVPEQIDFKTKPEIALEHIRWACEEGLPGEMVLIDAGYGHDSKLRAGITELGKVYAAGIQPQILVCPPGKRLGGVPKKRLGGVPKKGHRRAPD